VGDSHAPEHGAWRTAAEIGQGEGSLIAVCLSSCEVNLRFSILPQFER
jgi:hypothetical protein